MVVKNAEFIHSTRRCRGSTARRTIRCAPLGIAGASRASPMPKAAVDIVSYVTSVAAVSKSSMTHRSSRPTRKKKTEEQRWIAAATRKKGV